MNLSDIDISKALALAIGWPADRIHVAGGDVWVCESPGFGRCGWCVFRYTDWDVIGPIAERYNCFPTYTWGEWQASIDYGTIYARDTPQEAIAMAVINGAKK